jgi:two-component system, cell cycle sensor histidine kinase and response regulator CckA
MFQKLAEGDRAQSVALSAPGAEVHSLLQYFPDAVFLIDPQGRILDANSPALDLTGRTRQDLLGTGLKAFVASHLICGPDEDEGPPSVAALQDEASERRRLIFSAPDGRQLQVLLSAGPVVDRDGNRIATLLTIQTPADAPAMKPQEVRPGRRGLQGDTIAGLIHDFNNVLNTISQAVTVLDGNGLRSPDDVTLLNIIRNAVGHGAETVNHVREQLAGIRRQRTDINLRHLLEEVLELAHPILKRHRRVKVQRNLVDCPSIYGNCDELRRAFSNLLLNALEAMPNGGVLSVGCTHIAGSIVVSMRDTGTGIPLKLQCKMFSPYFTTKANGTGLGLAGARRAVRALGGDIRFESSPGVGTTFYVTLPAAVHAADPSPLAA